MTKVNTKSASDSNDSPVLSVPPPVFNAGDNLGKYTIIELIAQGGMGDIYLASDLTFDRLVAIKCLSSRLASDPTFIDRFYREAKATAAVVHNNVVTIHDLSKKDDIPYFVMEYIEGETLSQKIRKNGQLTVSQALPVIKHAALGLQAAFESGLIHRDVKPSNIIINSRGVAKLTDFGLVMSLSEPSRITHSDIILGSPHYISPEQARGEEVIDFRTDIYSLGITLYHALAGKLPFSASTPMGIMLRHVNDPLPPIEEEAPHLSGSVIKLVDLMTKKNREERFSSYTELLDTINKVMSTIDNRSPSSLENQIPEKAASNSSAAMDNDDKVVPVASDDVTVSERANANTDNASNAEQASSTNPSLNITKKHKVPLPSAYDELGGYLGTLIAVYTNPQRAFNIMSSKKLNLKIPLTTAALCLIIVLLIIIPGRSKVQICRWYFGYTAFLLTDIILILPVYIFAGTSKREKHQLSSSLTTAVNLLFLSWIAQIWFAARWLFFLAFPTPWIAYCGLEHLLKLHGSKLKLTWLLCLILFIARVMIGIGAARYGTILCHL